MAIHTKRVVILVGVLVPLKDEVCDFSMFWTFDLNIKVAAVMMNAVVNPATAVASFPLKYISACMVTYLRSAFYNESLSHLWNSRILQSAWPLLRIFPVLTKLGNSTSKLNYCNIFYMKLSLRRIQEEDRTGCGPIIFLQLARRLFSGQIQRVANCLG